MMDHLSAAKFRDRAICASICKGIIIAPGRARGCRTQAKNPSYAGPVFTAVRSL